MLDIGFLVTPGFPVSSLAALSVFEFANLEAKQTLYKVHVLSEHGGLVSTTLGTQLDTVAFDVAHFDTLIIGGNIQIVPTSPALLLFLAAALGGCRRLSSICTGVFALGDAGILDGRRVTTHWLFTSELKARFPSIRLDADRLFVIDGSVWTAAGNGAGIDLTLCMLENDYGFELALAVAKIMVIDYQRSGGQSQHSALLGINPKTDRIQDALNYARANLRSSLTVSSLATAARLGVRQFARTFQAETGVSPAKAIEQLRLEAARLMIDQTAHPISFIAVETGFGDEERMRRSFVRAFGHSPQSLRQIQKHDRSND